MKNSTRIAIAGLLSAAGSVLTAFASEFSGEAPASSESAAAPEAPKTTKPKKEKTTPAPAQPETPAEQDTPVTPAAEKLAAPEVTNPKYEEHRALIAPLVQGEDSTAELRQQVKDLIKKYDPDNTPHSLKTMPTKNHAAFEKDIAALGY